MTVETVAFDFRKRITIVRNDDGKLIAVFAF